MKFTGLKKIAGSLALGAVLATGLASAAQAQVWGRSDDRYERREQREEWKERQRREREEWKEQQRREREARRYGGYNNGRYGNYGGYGNYGNYGGYGNSSAYRQEVEKGYRDGLDRGRQDAQTRRTPTPNNSSHYRNGNQAYREGFARGYEQAYRQYAYNGQRW